ncbi:hypothetical protein B0J11DRAFT_591741 [Dendryphion nanum]|uniref:Uncharacterized protein n=1 Tax=Dendryphion nanum TaxID=256645 RepID=A0A9P9DGP7_9PLEO|nr:hypothetical protein B0J11DRAFT_591741 [Dendryphion nanum]
MCKMTTSLKLVIREGLPPFRPAPDNGFAWVLDVAGADWWHHAYLVDAPVHLCLYQIVQCRPCTTRPDSISLFLSSRSALAIEMREPMARIRSCPRASTQGKSGGGRAGSEAGREDTRETNRGRERERQKDLPWRRGWTSGGTRRASHAYARREGAAGTWPIRCPILSKASPRIAGHLQLQERWPTDDCMIAADRGYGSSPLLAPPNAPPSGTSHLNLHGLKSSIDVQLIVATRSACRQGVGEKGTKGGRRRISSFRLGHGDNPSPSYGSRF